MKLVGVGYEYQDLPGWEFTVVTNEQGLATYSVPTVRDGGVSGGGSRRAVTPRCFLFLPTFVDGSRSEQECLGVSN